MRTQVRSNIRFTAESLITHITGIPTSSTFILMYLCVILLMFILRNLSVEKIKNL
jgi:hypothetical protein